jgi:hypothetical protein
MTIPLDNDFHETDFDAPLRRILPFCGAEGNRK